MTLFTGKGDSGTTKFFDSKKGGRTSKNSERAEALGSLDELNSFLGVCKVNAQEHLCEVKEEQFVDIIRRVQGDLFIIQAEAAGAEKCISEAKVKWVEDLIHTIEKEIPPITSFTIAGGVELAALLDVARTMARRTERRVVAVHENGMRPMEHCSLAYLNRLSSLLFALSRLVNFRAGVQEEAPDYK